MAWMLSWNAADGKKVLLCHDGDNAPDLGKIRFVNPRTKKTEGMRADGGASVAWVHTDEDCPESAIHIELAD